MLYELDGEPLAEPKPQTPTEAYRLAKEHFEDRLPHAKVFTKTAAFCVGENDLKEAAFLLHQSIEQAYAALLLVLTNYSPASHNLKHLRASPRITIADSSKLGPAISIGSRPGTTFSTKLM